MLIRHARCVLSRLRCNGHSFLFSSYLFRIGRIENPCSACDISHLILHCPVTDTLSRSLLATLCLYDLRFRPWAVARFLGLHTLQPCLFPQKGSGGNSKKQGHSFSAVSNHPVLVNLSRRGIAIRKRSTVFKIVQIFSNLLKSHLTVLLPAIFTEFLHLKNSKIFCQRSRKNFQDL